MAPLIQRIKDWWSGADRTQRMISIFGAAFLVVLILGTVMFSSRTRMEPIAPGASQLEQGMIRDAVMSYGFAATIENGQVMVPANKLDEIKMRLSVDGKMPQSSTKGLELLNEGGMFMTPAREKEIIKAAREGEVTKSIQRMAGVQSAIATINFGKDSAFADESEPPSAVVNVTEKPNANLDSESGRAIALIVQNAVPGMKPDSVTVVTNQGRVIYDGAEMSGRDAMATKKIEAEASESKRRERDIQRRLDQAFGTGATIAMVQVELNMDEVETAENTTSPTRTPISRSSTSETLSGQSDPTGGPSGGDSTGMPNALASAPTSNGASNYSAESTDEQYGVEEKKTTTKKAAGEVVAMNVNVLVDTKRVPDSAAVENFVNGALATAEERNFKATVTPTEFSTESTEELKKATAEAAGAARMQQLMSILPIAALIVVGLILAKTLANSLKPKAQPEFALAGGAGALTLPMDQASLEALLSGGPSTAPTSASEDQLLALVSNESSQHGSEEDDDFGMPEFVGEIKQRIDVPLEQIRKLSKDKPEMVALLLKTWMMEDM